MNLYKQHGKQAIVDESSHANKQNMLFFLYIYSCRKQKLSGDETRKPLR